MTSTTASVPAANSELTTRLQELVYRYAAEGRAHAATYYEGISWLYSCVLGMIGAIASDAVSTPEEKLANIAAVLEACKDCEGLVRYYG